MEPSWDEPFAGIEAKPGRSHFSLGAERMDGWARAGRWILAVLKNKHAWRWSMPAALGVALLVAHIREDLAAAGSWLWWLL